MQAGRRLSYIIRSPQMHSPYRDVNPSRASICSRLRPRRLTRASASAAVKFTAGRPSAEQASGELRSWVDAQEGVRGGPPPTSLSDNPSSNYAHRNTVCVIRGIWQMRSSAFVDNYAQRISLCVIGHPTALPPRQRAGPHACNHLFKTNCSYEHYGTRNKMQRKGTGP